MTGTSTYVHLPFCRGRCPYCDFASTELGRGALPAAAYRAALERELRWRATPLAGRAPVSTYVGGGTPSLWSADDLGALLDGLARVRGLGAEVTVEANPGDGSADWYAQLVEAHGVTRFSIGVQALDEGRLAWLGRRHDGAAAERAIAAARAAGARSISADLMYGTPAQRPEDLAREVARLLELGVDHLSAYELTVPAGSALERTIAAGASSMLEDDQLIELWQAVGDTARAHGLARYEVSSYARPGHRCAHNEHYWEGGDYLGLGAGAHGCLADTAGSRRRYANTGDIAGYLVAAHAPDRPEPRSGLGARQHTEDLDAATRARELLMLGLRTIRGVRLAEVLGAVPPELGARWSAVIEDLVAQQLVEVVDERLAPRGAGMLLADGLAARFF